MVCHDSNRNYTFGEAFCQSVKALRIARLTRALARASPFTLLTVVSSGWRPRTGSRMDRRSQPHQRMAIPSKAPTASWPPLHAQRCGDSMKKPSSARSVGRPAYWKAARPPQCSSFLQRQTLQCGWTRVDRRETYFALLRHCVPPWWVLTEALHFTA